MKKIAFSHEQYVPIEEIGRGGMGVVYKCTDCKMLGEVAVKVIGWNPSNDEVVRFHKEAKALAKLQHPNILSVLHFGHSDDDSLFLVMELLNGKSLSSLIESEIVPPFEDALTIFIQICDGLAHAHRKEILHRDIKPSNIFMERTARGDIKITITDFGLAKLLTEDQRMTKTGVSLGTPAYMSPEQAGGKSVDERADIYSLGCLMFEVLSGRQPFQASTIPALLMKHVNEPAPKLSDVVPDYNYPEEIEQILAKCLAKDKDERYSKIADLRADLQNLKESLATTYAQLDSSSDSQTGSAARMNEFLLSTVQQSPSQRRARTTFAVIVVTLVAAGLTVLVFIKLNVASFKEKVPTITEEELNITSAKTKEDDDKTTAAFIDKSIKYKKDDKFYTKCRGVGGGLRLLELARTAHITFKESQNCPYYIDANDSDVNDVQLHSLVGLPILGLRVNGSKAIDDDALRDTVSKIETLTDLELGTTKVTDKGVAYLTANKNLQWINLWNTAVTDESLNTLAKIGSLNSICVTCCPRVTGSTFGALRRFKKPIVLSIGGSKIKLENLKTLQNLQIGFLDASALNLKDRDLAVIADIPTLTGLLMDYNPDVTPAGFLQLAKLKKLILVSIEGCPKITSDTIKKLKALHPTPEVDVKLKKVAAEE